MDFLNMKLHLIASLSFTVDLLRLYSEANTYYGSQNVPLFIIVQHLPPKILHTVAVQEDFCVAFCSL